MEPSATRTFDVPALTANGAKISWEKAAGSTNRKVKLLVNTTTLDPSADRVRLQKWNDAQACGTGDGASDIVFEVSDCNGVDSYENKMVCQNVEVPAGDWRVCLCDESASHDCSSNSHFTVAATNKVSVPELNPTRALASSNWLVAGTTVLESITLWGHNFDSTNDKLGLVEITESNKASPCDGSSELEKANVPCNLGEADWGMTRVVCGPIPSLSRAGTFAICMCDGNSKFPIRDCGSQKDRYDTPVPEAKITYVAAATATSVKKIAGKSEAGLRAIYEIDGTNLDPVHDRIIAIQETDTCGSNTSKVEGIDPGSLKEWSELTCDAGPGFRHFIKTASAIVLSQQWQKWK